MKHLRETIKAPEMDLTIGKSWAENVTIQGSIVTAAEGDAINTMFITSCYPGDGKSATTCAMAMALTQGSINEVVLIDGNLRRPRLHEMLNQDVDPGLTDLLFGEATVEDVIKPTVTSNLFSITAGKTEVDAVSFFRSPVFSDLLARLRQRFDYVILDGPDYLGRSECPFLATMFDGVILVIDYQNTRWKVAKLVNDRIAAVGGRVIGAVMNRRRFVIPKSLYRVV